MKNEKITRSEFQQMLADYQHHLSVRVPVGDDMNYVIANATVYNPYEKFQIGFRDNAWNAAEAMKYIKNKAVVTSSVFNFCEGVYEIED